MLGFGASAVGDAGTGSYEPTGLTVLAVEPSRQMLAQRGPHSAPPEHLPVRDKAVDVAMAVLTVHHWTGWRRGIAELRRIARSPVRILAPRARTGRRPPAPQ